VEPLLHPVEVTSPRDVAELSPALVAATDANALLALVLDTVEDLMLLFRVDDDGELTCASVNGAWARTTGQAPESLLDRPLREVLPERAAGRLLLHATGALSGATTTTFADRLVLPTGPVELDVTLSAAFLRGPAPGRYVLWVGRDVTERRRVEEAGRRAQQELERSNADLAAFASVASHDLQEPLRMVTSYVELLSRRYRDQLDPRAGTYMDFALDGAIRMRSLIEAILDYAQFRAASPSIASVDVVSVVQDVLADLGPQIRAHAATVVVDDLPTVLADASELGRLFQNLLGNALKFRGAEDPVVRITCAALADGWQIAVRDNGIGIPVEQRDRVFEMFGRLHPAAEYPGTGMGLALCRTIVERLGGRMWIDDTPTGGTTVALHLPDRGAAEEFSH
jgi:PAS domain S-box-containing protein